MPGQGRLGDQANAHADAHGCPGCPHPTMGPAVSGSPDVFVNGRPAVRVDDVGIHAACCAANLWHAQEGSASVFINGKPAHRIGDATQHCGGRGQLTQGSDDVIVGGSPTHQGQDGADSPPTSAVAFTLEDEWGDPIAGVRFVLVAADGSEWRGETDDAGNGRQAQIKPGRYTLKFVEDDDARS